jgi:hypothetical protein
MRGYMLDHAVIGRSAPIVETAVVRSDGSNLAAVLLGLAGTRAGRVRGVFR